MSAAKAAASHALMRDAADEVLAEHGSAVDAVIAGFFALAGDECGALLAPIVALVGGAGAGGRVIDGRAAQPGAGAPRPRGFLSDAPVPLAAYAAASRSIPALFHLHAAHARSSFGRLARAGVERARALGAEERAKFLRRVASEGVTGLRRDGEAILRVAGVHANGLVTEEDLGGAPDDMPAELVELTAKSGEETRVLLEPWFKASSAREPVAQVVVAADARGMIAALAVHVGQTSRGGDQLVVPELEIALPLCARPVMRGQERTKPGVVLSAPSTLALLDAGASLRVALGQPCGTTTALPQVLAERPVERGLERAVGAVAVIAGSKSCDVFEAPREASA